MSEEAQTTLPAPTPAQPTLKEVVASVAEQLGETEPGPLQLLRKVIKKLGPEQAQTFLAETLEVEAQGGMLLPDGSRRRTKGGVFFFLVRTKGPEEVRAAYWQQKKNPAAGGASSQSPAQATPAFAWEGRIAVLSEIGTEKGQATTLKITLIGRPGRIIDRGTCFITSMESQKVPSLPKGLPTPPETKTTYTVYIASKQWRKVESVVSDPDDVLILEGYPQLDAKTGSIAVFVTNATTKKLQAAQRQAQPAASTNQ